MNYYLSRDGQTLGPYPEESFPAMLQAGQVVSEDLVCPEGGSDWVPLTQIPILAGQAATKSPSSNAGGLSLKIDTSPKTSTAGTTANAYSYSTAGAMPAQRQASQSPVVAFIKRKVWVVATALAIVLCFALWGPVRDMYIAGQLNSEPGWKAFNASNSRIKSEKTEAGYGNNDQATQLARNLASVLHLIQKEGFVLRKRGILGVSNPDGGKGQFQISIDLRNDRALILIHIPDFDMYEDKARTAMRTLCWEGAHATIDKGEMNKNPEFTLVVGLRDADTYDRVYVAKFGEPSAMPPVAAEGNMACQKLLVKWFAEGKP